MKKNFKVNQIVKINQLGDGKEYLAKIAGKSFDNILDVYIVELLESFPNNPEKWTHICIPESCLTDKI